MGLGGDEVDELSEGPGGADAWVLRFEGMGEEASLRPGGMWRMRFLRWHSGGDDEVGEG